MAMVPGEPGNRVPKGWHERPQRILSAWRRSGDRKGNHAHAVRPLDHVRLP